MENKIENDQPKSIITEGIAIASIPIIGYFLSFIYEVAYARSFGIPQELISLNILNILVSTISTFLFFIVLFVYVERISLHITRNPYTYHFTFAFWWFFITIINIFIYGIKNYDKWSYCFYTFLFILLFDVAWLFLILRNKGGLKDRLLYQYNHEKELYDKGISLPQIIRNITGRQLFQIIQYILLAYLCANWAGEYSSFKKKDFLVLKNKPNIVVLKIYGDTIITAPFSKKTKTIRREVTVYKISDKDNLTLVSEKIGPLKLEK